MHQWLKISMKTVARSASSIHSPFMHPCGGLLIASKSTLVVWRVLIRESIGGQGILEGDIWPWHSWTSPLLSSYLTPPDSQGFAPHYDDIEAFILQVEGSKRWRIYSEIDGFKLPEHSSRKSRAICNTGVSPFSPTTYSSVHLGMICPFFHIILANFSQAEIGDPIMDVILEAGDLLYFPRGMIHQGITLEGQLSHHVTVSTYQKNEWGHFFQHVSERVSWNVRNRIHRWHSPASSYFSIIVLFCRNAPTLSLSLYPHPHTPTPTPTHTHTHRLQMIPRALSIAMQEDVLFREGMPINFLEYMGLSKSDKVNLVMVWRCERSVSRTLSHCNVMSRTSGRTKESLFTVGAPIGCYSWAAVPRQVTILYALLQPHRPPLYPLLCHNTPTEQYSNDSRRAKLQKHVQKLFARLAQFADADLAADSMAIEYLHDCMPPHLDPVEAPKR